MIYHALNYKSTPFKNKKVREGLTDEGKIVRQVEKIVWGGIG